MPARFVAGCREKLSVTATEKTTALTEALEALARGDQPGAVQTVQSLVAKSGESAESLHVLGLVAIQLGDLSRAIELMKAAHELDPACRDYVDGLAIVFARAGRLNDSLYYGKLATALKPHADLPGLLPAWLGNFEDTFANMRDSTYFQEGMQAYDAGQLDAAIDCFEKEAELYPGEGRAWRMLSRVMMRLGRPVEALLLLEALRSCQDFAREDYFLLGRAYEAIGKFDKAIDSHLQGAGGEIRHVTGLIGRLSVLAAKQGASVKEIVTLEERLAGLLSSGVKIMPERPVAAEGKLKVGLVSGRFRAGTGLDLFWPLLIQGRRSGLDFFCYSHNEYDDAMTRRIAGAVADFIDLRDVNDPTAATIIHNDEIDILIDLDGYLETGRAMIFASKPAPVMLRVRSMPETVAVHGFQASLAGQGGFSQANRHCLAIKDGLFALPDDKLPQDPALSARPGRRILGWKPDLNRIQRHSIAIIERILDQDPSIRISLFVQGCGGIAALDYLEPLLEKSGLLPRIDYAEPCEKMKDGLSQFFQGVDLLIDIEGDCGMDRAFEALCASLPVISLAGPRPQERTVTEFLTGVGLAEACYEDAEEFAKACAELLRDRAVRSGLKQKAYDCLMAERKTERVLARLQQLETGLNSLAGREG
ncbi:tetratricopeptide repeat protein [Aestuariispira insulae]|uniref:protein O-GlcNAc transferase n=1 Tax=Aestuariispira insulae TaxID=1461337 RepID=A0A3D9HSG8_9PROT|nr:glycosyltransferase family 41 protein [Aestuariispira insulae]RED52437.1 tetratricopeptide repeat protein [Aestuariispira insulae]